MTFHIAFYSLALAAFAVMLVRIFQQKHEARQLREERDLYLRKLERTASDINLSLGENVKSARKTKTRLDRLTTANHISQSVVIAVRKSRNR